MRSNIHNNIRTEDPVALLQELTSHICSVGSEKSIKVHVVARERLDSESQREQRTADKHEGLLW